MVSIKLAGVASMFLFSLNSHAAPRGTVVSADELECVTTQSSQGAPGFRLTMTRSQVVTEDERELRFGYALHRLGVTGEALHGGRVMDGEALGQEVTTQGKPGLAFADRGFEGEENRAFSARVVGLSADDVNIVLPAEQGPEEALFPGDLKANLSLEMNGVTNEHGMNCTYVRRFLAPSF